MTNTANVSVTKAMNLKTRELLKRLRITPNKRGYEYLVDLILRSITREVRPGYLSKTGFPVTARKCNAGSSERVERACRAAICYSYERESEKYMEVFGIDKRPSVSEFVFTIADHLILQEEMKMATTA